MSVASVIAVSGITGLVVTFILGFSFIPWLGKLEFGNTFTAFERNHAVPTMGGIIIAIGTASAILLAVVTDKITGGEIVSSGSMMPQEMNTKLWSGVIMAVSLSLVGMIDDYYKIRTRQNLGLPVKQVSVMQFFVILAYLTGLYMGMNGKPYMFIPFFGNAEPGFFYWITGIIFIYASVNAVGISDGVDGLCEAITVTSAISLGVIAVLKGFFGFALMSAATAGACVGIILWNMKFVKIRIGKTGMFFLGGMIVAVSYALGCPLILLLAGLSYFVIGASNILQIVYYKKTGGKPLLRNAPVQHHLKLIGWNDKKIVLTFTALNILGGAVAVAVMHYGRYI